MHDKLILWMLLFISVQEVFLQDLDYYDSYGYDDPLNCSTTESIKNGHVSYSQGGLEGSVLTYHCGPGKYPFPVSYRVCAADGEWSPMRLPSGRPVSRATCKDVLCPAQLQLDHGDFWPRNQWFNVGATQNFTCQEGFTLYGTALRTCTPSGHWTGSTPVCYNHDASDDCNDPGIPPGATRSSGYFYTGEKVVYQCQTGMHLLGSAERVCMENREWSGSTPRCQGPHTFDSPSDVAAAMAGSLAGVMDVLSPDAKREGEQRSFGRTFHVTEGSRINIFILLDTSGSISEAEFNKSRSATIALIKKLDSYEVQLNFHIVSFASEAKDIVDIREPEISSDIDEVLLNLIEFKYNSHGQNTGTNLHAALRRVGEMIAFLKQNSATNHFNATQNVIVIETDGNSNTGSKPQIALAHIRNLLGYHHLSSDHTQETMLDVYVFGIGEKVNKEQLNSLASKKTGEDHVFILKDYEALGFVFNSIISDKSVTMCGIAQEDTTEEQGVFEKGVYKRPWHVKVLAFTQCVGSIVSESWVLTAAHCFAKASTETIHTTVSVQLSQGEETLIAKRVIMHPKYNTRALQNRNVSEFYDYDVALVQVNKSIQFSWKARPICIPCTVAATRAMKKVNSTCQQHRQDLLPQEETEAFFIHKDSKRQSTYIQTGSQRRGCVEKAMQTLKEDTDVTLEEYVPERFLCSGGSKTHQNDVTCKGDSGGSLFLQKRNRYFQVGVVSWGTIDICNNPALSRYRNKQPPPNARDFHIDLFKIMPWLKQHLGKEIQFLEDIE